MIILRLCRQQATTKKNWRSMFLLHTCMKFCYIRCTRRRAPRCARDGRARRGLYGVVSAIPMCCEPKVVRLRIGRPLCRSTYARRNCPPDNDDATEGSEKLKPSLCASSRLRIFMTSNCSNNSGTAFSCSATCSTWSSMFPYCLEKPSVE